jgi:hypothetical protein
MLGYLASGTTLVVLSLARIWRSVSRTPSEPPAPAVLPAGIALEPAAGLRAEAS